VAWRSDTPSRASSNVGLPPSAPRVASFLLIVAAIVGYMTYMPVERAMQVLQRQVMRGEPPRPDNELIARLNAVQDWSPYADFAETLGLMASVPTEKNAAALADRCEQAVAFAPTPYFLARCAVDLQVAGRPERAANFVTSLCKAYPESVACSSNLPRSSRGSHRRQWASCLPAAAPCGLEPGHGAANGAERATNAVATSVLPASDRWFASRSRFHRHHEPLQTLAIASNTRTFGCTSANCLEPLAQRRLTLTLGLDRQAAARRVEHQRDRHVTQPLELPLDRRTVGIEGRRLCWRERRDAFSAPIVDLMAGAIERAPHAGQHDPAQVGARMTCSSKYALNRAKWSLAHVPLASARSGKRSPGVGVQAPIMSTVSAGSAWAMPA
jgi:hypothetical protein